MANAAGTLACTTTAQALAASTPCVAVQVQSDFGNAVGNDILVGTQAAQTMRLRPGDVETIITTNVSNIYAKTIAGTAQLNWLSS